MSDSKSKAVSSFDFVSLSVLNNWSHAGFQGLRDNHILEDLLEAVLSENFDRSKVMKHVYNFAYGRVTFIEPKKPVSGKQIIELVKTNQFGQLLDDITKWTNFFELLSFLSNASVWFENNKPDWEARDKFRECLGLEPLNPVFETPKGLKTILKLVGREYKLILEPLDGYRFVSKEESGIYSSDYIGKYRVVFHEDYKNCGKSSPFGFSNPNIYVIITKL